MGGGGGARRAAGTCGGGHCLGGRRCWGSRGAAAVTIKTHMPCDTLTIRAGRQRSAPLTHAYRPAPPAGLCPTPPHPHPLPGQPTQAPPPTPRSYRQVAAPQHAGFQDDLVVRRGHDLPGRAGGGGDAEACRPHAGRSNITTQGGWVGGWVSASPAALQARAPPGPCWGSAVLLLPLRSPLHTVCVVLRRPHIGARQL